MEQEPEGGYFGEEPKQNALVAARWRLKNGAKLEDLSPPQLKAYMKWHNRISEQQAWKARHPGVPFEPRTRQRIRDYARLQVDEGVSATDAALKMNLLPASMWQMVLRYKAFYLEVMSEAIGELKGEAEQQVQAERVRSIRRSLEMSKKADEEVRAILESSTASPFAKIQVRKQIKTELGVGVEGHQQPVGGSLPREFVALLRDQIGLVRDIMKSKEPTPIEAEVELLPLGADGSGGST